MSARVEQILEVIQEVLENFQIRRGHTSLKEIRIQAVHSVANRRGIDYRSVGDKFIRQLRPEIYSADQFDEYLTNWLLNDSDALQSIILRHVSDDSDEALITSTFYKAPDDDTLLAREFGYDPSEETFKEGKLLLKIHLTKERNYYLVKRAKMEWCDRWDGNIRCSICNFSFTETYGEVGAGFIEAHHIQPISSLTPNTAVRVEDLVPVCSNCHSMLHRHRPWLSVEQLRGRICAQKANKLR